ncbi:acyltransferase family protein [Pseudomonas sp. IT-P176]|uniref:acyltransferase family protein n=1 Tax=Pseudomonas sp. IT-P176 TaxID=3026444 RepID=UPI0039E11A83
MSTKINETRNRGFVSEFEGLRGILALWVVVGHMMSGLSESHALPSASLWNTVPVQVFIILSGFVIFSLLDREQPSYRTFLIHRAFRLFPAYLLALAISVFMLPFAREVLLTSPVAPMTAARIALIDSATSNLSEHLAAHLLLIQGLIPDSLLANSAYTLVGQAWSVSVEWQFYVLAPAVYLLMGAPKRLLKLPALCALIMLMISLNSSMGGGYIGQYLSLFAVGIATAYLSKYSEKSKILSVLPPLLALPFMQEYTAALLIWAASSYCALPPEKNSMQGVLSAVLNSTAASYLGKISYSIYVNHMIFVFLTLAIINTLSMSSTSTVVLAIAASTVLTVVFSHVTYSYIERPMMRVGKYLTRTKSNLATA